MYTPRRGSDAHVTGNVNTFAGDFNPHSPQGE